MAETTTNIKHLYPGESSKPGAITDPKKSQRQRRLRLCLIITSVVLLLLIITLVVLFLTVLRVRDPTTTLLSSRVTGVAPRVNILPSPSIQLNVTLDLTVQVNNPNPAAFSHGVGHTQLYYRGTQIGDADIEPGRIPSRGSGLVEMSLTVQADRFADQLGDLISDVEAGQMGLDATTAIPGRVKILGLFGRHAVAHSQCHVVIGVPDLKVRSQYCENKTDL